MWTEPTRQGFLRTLPRQIVQYGQIEFPDEGTLIIRDVSEQGMPEVFQVEITVDESLRDLRMIVGRAMAGETICKVELRMYEEFCSLSVSEDIENYPDWDSP